MRRSPGSTVSFHSEMRCSSSELRFKSQGVEEQTAEDQLEQSLPSREATWELVTEYITSESLRRHCLAVETAMRAYARKFGESEDEWGIVGLVHDYDFEVH